MRTGVKSHHFNDFSGNPGGGTTFGPGFAIGWQNGPLGRHSPNCSVDCATDCTRKPQNGAFVADIIAAAADRLAYYQRSRFACKYNALALDHLNSALVLLCSRTDDREKRKVEGAHQI